MDTLSDMLKAFHVQSAVFFHAKLTAPWYFDSPQACSLPGPFQSSCSRLLAYHFVVEGACTVQPAGSPPIVLRAGDVIFLPHGDSHGMGSSHLAEPGAMLNIDDLLRNRAAMSTQSGGATTHLICGYLACYASVWKSVLAELP